MVTLDTSLAVNIALHHYFHVIGSFVINDDLTVSVNGLVLQHRQAQSIPFKFKTLKGFTSFGNGLKDLSCLPDESFEKIRITWYPDLALLRCLNASRIDLEPSSWSDPSMSARYHKAMEILFKYEGQGQSAAMVCAAELAQAGLKANARWYTGPTKKPNNTAAETARSQLTLIHNY